MRQAADHKSRKLGRIVHSPWRIATAPARPESGELTVTTCPPPLLVPLPLTRNIGLTAHVLCCRCICRLSPVPGIERKVPPEGARLQPKDRQGTLPGLVWPLLRGTELHASAASMNSKHRGACSPVNISTITGFVQLGHVFRSASHVLMLRPAVILLACYMRHRYPVDSKDMRNSRTAVVLADRSRAVASCHHSLRHRCTPSMPTLSRCQLWAAPHADSFPTPWYKIQSAGSPRHSPVLNIHTQ